uniref:Carbonic anhydrase n=1 Tax=Oryza punctata TaxID=4537 RepID=A0A0E0M251_ORYPU
MIPWPLRSAARRLAAAAAARAASVAHSPPPAPRPPQPCPPEDAALKHLRRATGHEDGVPAGEQPRSRRPIHRKSPPRPRFLRRIAVVASCSLPRSTP